MVLSFIDCLRLFALLLSYLKTLIGPFNKMVNAFLDQIKPLADGEKSVPMKRHFGELALNIVSKVGQKLKFSVSYWLIAIVLYGLYTITLCLSRERNFANLVSLY